LSYIKVETCQEEKGLVPKLCINVVSVA